jgi:hypothetical protein
MKSLLFILCLLISDSFAMEKTAHCFIQTKDEEVPLTMQLADRFQMLSSLLNDFSPEQIQREKISVLATSDIFKKTVELVKLDMSKDHTLITDICESTTIDDLIEMASCINYLHGPQAVLITVLHTLVKKLHAIRFEPSLNILKKVDELPREIQSMLNEIFLLKFRNICTFTRVVHNLVSTDTSAPNPVFSSNGRFMLVTTYKYYILYELSKKQARKVCAFPRTTFFNESAFSPDDRYLVMPGASCIYNLDTNESYKLSILRADILYLKFLTDTTFVMNSAGYDLKAPGALASLPIEDPIRAQLKGRVQHALYEDGIDVEKIKTIYNQLPKHVTNFDSILSIEVAGNYLALGEDLACELFDISDPCQIKVVYFEIASRFAFNRDHKKLILQKADELVILDLLILTPQVLPIKNKASKPQSRFSPRIQPESRTTSHGISKERETPVFVPESQKEIAARISDCTRGDKALVRCEGKLSEFIFVHALNSFVEIPLPFHFDDEQSDEKPSAQFLSSDDEFVITTGRNPDGKNAIRVCHMPVSALKKCSFGEIIMLLNYLKKTDRLDDLYFKDLYKQLDPAVKELYQEVILYGRLQSQEFDSELLDFIVEDEPTGLVHEDGQ